MNSSQPEPNEELTASGENLPKLYSKRVILCFCAFFSVLFGGVLLMRNMAQTGNKKAQAEVFIFSLLYMILAIFIMGVFELGSNLAFIFNIVGAAILNEYFWNKYLEEMEYEKKSWYKPALISLSIAFVLFLLIASFAS